LPIDGPWLPEDVQPPSPNPAKPGRLDAGLDALDWLAGLDDLERGKPDDP
jgi:hypothetical protein